MSAYVGARTVIGDHATLKITANFRSVEPILTFVNAKFEPVLSTAAGQPGFTELSPIRQAEDAAPAVAALDVTHAEKPSAPEIRDAEAERVAELCSRLVNNRQVRGEGHEGVRPCRLGDIALLAPVGTDLWRFEQALEDRGIPVSTQAGKGFFRRQEIQDLIALTRTLADGRDTLALGALLRGPLIGLTEAELLDIAEALPGDPERPDRLPQLSLWTDLQPITHSLARTVLQSLQSLARQAQSATPYALLSDAVGLLDIRSQLRQRFKAGADRALANVDVFLEMSRAYDVRGLRAFAADMRANWEEAVRQVEGRPDAEKDSVALITIHASKGLEWPIVIPINMTGAPKAESGLMHDRRTECFSTPLFGVEPEDYSAIKEWSVTELQRERVRLWYVAATRARDLLILPRHSCALSNGAYAKIVDFDLSSLNAIEPEALGEPMAPPSAPAENHQTRDIFAAESSEIARAHRTVAWHQPSRSELTAPVEVEPLPVFNSAELVEDAVEQAVVPVAGSPTRGTLLHKLMEEVLTGETLDSPEALLARASELMAQLALSNNDETGEGVSAQELTQTVVRTLAIPEIAALRPRLVPEHTISGSSIDHDGETIVSGVADAVAYDADGRIDTIIDWKSDVYVTPDRLNSYRGQLEAYQRHTGARHAFLALMTPGRLIKI